MKKIVSILISVCVLLTLSACGEQPEENEAENTAAVSETAPATERAPAETIPAETITLEAIENPPDDSIVQLGELRFRLPEKYEKDGWNYAYFEEYRDCWNGDDGWLTSEIGTDVFNSLKCEFILSGRDIVVEECEYFYGNDKTEPDETREFSVDGVEASQETISGSDEYSSGLFSVVTIKTETQTYMFMLSIFGLNCDEKINQAFDDFNKMIEGMEISEEKREPKEFTDDIKSLIETPRTDGVVKALPCVEFILPEDFKTEYKELGTEDSPMPVYYCISRTDVSAELSNSNSTFQMRVYDHETYSLMEGLNEELFRSLTDTDLYILNMDKCFISADENGSTYSVYNIKRLTVDGYPAIYFENDTGFRNCLIIYMEDACRVIVINEQDRIRYNELSPLRYTDYVYGNLKLTSAEASEVDIFTDDLSKYITDETFPEEDYVYYHNGNIAVINPTGYIGFPGEEKLELGWDLELENYYGTPLELIDEGFFTLNPWDNPYLNANDYVKVVDLLKGKYNGYNCVIARTTEETYASKHDFHKLYMIIDAEEYGMFVLSARLYYDEYIAEYLEYARKFFSAVKIGEGVVKPETKFNDSIEDIIPHREYESAEYTEFFDKIKLVVPDYLRRLQNDNNKNVVAYESVDERFELFIEDISSVIDKPSGHYLDNKYFIYGDVYNDFHDFRLTKIDGRNTAFLNAAYLVNVEDYYKYYAMWQYVIFDSDGKIYLVRFYSHDKINDEIKAKAEEILGSLKFI